MTAKNEIMKSGVAAIESGESGLEAKAWRQPWRRNGWRQWRNGVGISGRHGVAKPAKMGGNYLKKSKKYRSRRGEMAANAWLRQWQ
jgi:hypothetical protein